MDINKENLIEGIGDEVLIVISLLLITFIVFLLWLSKDLHCFPAYIRRLLNQNQIDLNPIEMEVNEGLDQMHGEGDIGDNELIKNEGDVLKSLDDMPKNILEIDDSEENQGNNSNGVDDLPNGFITIKLKYLDDRLLVINVDPQSTVLDFKRNNFQEELSNNKAVRLIYNGRELKELNGEATLAGYGLIHNSTIHCLVTVRRDNVNTANSSINDSLNSSTDVNLGNLMFPLFGFILSLFWYYRLNYKSHFNMMTTFALIGITGMYFIACFVSYSSPTANLYRDQSGRDQANNIAH